jgi:hypothetical protein
MIKASWTLQTVGDGLWSHKAKDVKVTSLNLAYINEEQDFGELRVYFDRKTWDPNKDGLIYTDSLFLLQLEVKLQKLGLDTSTLTYSEQGMQGKDYVSLDVEKTFIDSWTSACNVANMFNRHVED